MQNLKAKISGIFLSLTTLLKIAEPGRGAAEGEEPRGLLHPGTGALRRRRPRPAGDGGRRPEGEPRHGRAGLQDGRGGRRVKDNERVNSEGIA